MKHLISILLLVIFMIGCSKESKTYQYVTVSNDLLKSATQPKEHTFIERFSDYWEANSLNDFEAAYAYELPYLNFLKSLDWYLDFKKTAKRRYNITLLEITPDSKDDDIIYARVHFDGKNLDVNLTEKWIFINDIWYHSYSQSILPPKPPKLH